MSLVECIIDTFTGLHYVPQYPSKRWIFLNFQGSSDSYQLLTTVSLLEKRSYWSVSKNSLLPDVECPCSYPQALNRTFLILIE